MTEKQKDRQAIERTRKHWKEDYKKLILFGGDNPFFVVFNERTCALCLRHRSVCGGCLLGNGSGACCKPYWNARSATGTSNKPAFMAARAALDKRLGRALERLK